MSTLFDRLDDAAAPQPPEIRPGRRIAGRVLGLYAAHGRGFETRPAASLELGFDGIPGDRHSGATRRSGGREPWYPRGTEIRNDRQLSILSAEELQALACDLGVERLAPEWLGGNLLVEGIPQLSLLPPRTLLFFASGAVLKVDGDNAPCRVAGRAVAEKTGRAEIEFDFVKRARRRRGLVAYVERPGAIGGDDRFEARIPEQWIYSAG
ncbi:MOSC domain-containing protein [Jiella sp. M17.18]|uniref:MOSC domain-containing protein n=1 Tax=Jiella sp. M17.18 TaxID=3234247 RepID=UPI0034E02DD5